MVYNTILIRSTDAVTGLFMPVLQDGFYILSQEGRSIYSFLIEDCGISSEYISLKIKTVMIDGGPVDDIFNAKIGDGGVCALSGAMPGIVGAMMRIGSPYAAMRESITVKPGGKSQSGRKINIRLKLFNTILSDLGITFLKCGILIEKRRINELFKKHEDEIYTGCMEILYKGLPVKEESLFIRAWGDSNELVILKIETEDESKS